MLCAILILGIGLAGLVQGVTTALSSTKDSEIQTAAIFLATGQMESLRAEGYLLAGEKSGEFAEPFQRFRWRQTVAKTDLDGLYQVDIAIEQVKSSKTVYELKTMLFDSPSSLLGGENANGSGPGRKRRRGGANP